jgi:hypothetical protein
MFNSLDMAAVSQFNVEEQSSLDSRRKASFLFARARKRARWHVLWSMVRGKQNRLKDLASLQVNARRRPARDGNIVNVPLAQIVGSENRVDDFDSAFNPRNSHNSDRWIGIAAARRRGVVLPPVELIQVGDEYYVRDGHHRVSVARAAGQADIEARILYVLGD